MTRTFKVARCLAGMAGARQTLPPNVVTYIRPSPGGDPLCRISVQCHVSTTASTMTILAHSHSDNRWKRVSIETCPEDTVVMVSEYYSMRSPEARPRGQGGVQRTWKGDGPDVRQSRGRLFSFSPDVARS
jgi:hypothetical protein